MSKTIKSFLFNLLGFAILFIGLRYFLLDYTGITGIWKPLISFGIATLLAPKFQVVKTNDGEKLFMKWIFIKGVKEVK
jgi:hypothetical protein